MIGISESMVRKYERRGDLHAVRRGDNRVLYQVREVQAVRAARTAGTGSVHARQCAAGHGGTGTDRTPPGGDPAESASAATPASATTPASAATPFAEVLAREGIELRPPAWPHDEHGRSLPPWKVKIVNGKPVAIDDDPATKVDRVTAKLDAARKTLDAACARAAQERRALERAALALRREREQQARAAWRHARVGQIVDGVARSLAASGWPPPMVGAIADQLGAYLAQLDDRALTDDRVIAMGVHQLVARTLGPWS